jgi:hypothetical protein
MGERKGEMVSGAKRVSGSGQKGKRVVMFSSAMATESTMEKKVHPIPNLTTCPSCPGGREPIFVAIPVDLLRKKKKQRCKRLSGSHGKQKMDRKLKRGELPCVRHSKSLYKGRVVGGLVLVSMVRKKVMKKQRRSK